MVVDAEGVLGRELDGVLGRVLDGVFGLTLDGVFGRDGVTDAREDGRDREGVDFGKPIPEEQVKDIITAQHRFVVSWVRNSLR